jgi:hypothetical protein
MEAETQTQLLEIAAVIVGIVLIAGLVALVLVKTAASRRERRHRKISATRRAQATRYNLFDAPANSSEATPDSNKRKRRRRSSRQHMVIDILQPDQGGEPPAEPTIEKP